jgi:hypothetical protein
MKGIATILGVLMALPVSAQSDEAKESLVRKLERQRVSLRFDRAPLEEVVDYLRDATGVDFVLDRDLAPRRGVREITIRLTRVRLKSALRLLLGSHDLTAVYRHGALFILPRGKVTKSMTTRVYDVRDLLLKIRDVPGPVMELAGEEPGIVPIDWTDLVPPPATNRSRIPGGNDPGEHGGILLGRRREDVGRPGERHFDRGAIEKRARGNRRTVEPVAARPLNGVW